MIRKKTLSRPPRLWLLTIIGLAGGFSLLGAGCPLFPPTAPTNPTEPTEPEEPTTPFDHTTASFVGTDVCAGCHADIAAKFANNGHQYKLNKVEGGVPPTYPFTSLAGKLAGISDDDTDIAGGLVDPAAGTDNPAGTPASWNDVTYVIGGFGWKARWIDSQGFIVTGTNVQYNFATDGFSSYHNNQNDKKYNCGNCHTTGWKAYTSEAGDDRNKNRQDGLAGMEGTFFAPGVHCEACHGAGSAHAASPSKNNITKIATARTTEQYMADDMAANVPMACSDCHVRDSEKDYPTYTGGDGVILASGGFIRHHEQYDEKQGLIPDDVAAGPTGPHRDLACIACHDPHKTIKYEDISGDGSALIKTCADCHPGHEITSGGMQSLDCTDCHMPKLVKSAVASAAVGTGPSEGDIHSHIFRIDLSKTDQFVADGSKAYPWITPEWACKTCHNGVDATDFSLSSLASQNIH